MKGLGTNYPSNSTGEEVFAAVKLNVRLGNDFLEGRHDCG